MNPDQQLESLGSDLAPTTRHAYATDWSAFTTWCRNHGVTPLPAHAIAEPKVLRYPLPRPEPDCPAP